MKRHVIALLIIILLPVCLLFPNDGSSITLKGEGTDTATILIDNQAGTGTFELGFSTKYVGSILDDPGTITSPINVSVAPGQFYAYDDSVYLYWKFIGNIGKVSLSVKMTKEDSDVLDWSVSWDRSSSIPDGSTGTASTGQAEVFVYDPASPGGIPSGGSIRLKVQSGSIGGIDAGSHSATVSAILETVQ